MLIFVFPVLIAIQSSPDDLVIEIQMTLVPFYDILYILLQRSPQEIENALN